MATLQPNKDAEVTVVEQGDLKIVAETIAITANGSYDNPRTVPTGKKWFLIGIYHKVSTGTYTISGEGTYVTISAVNFTFFTGGADHTYNLVPWNVVLNAGAILHIGVTISGYSAPGNVETRLMYREMDA